MTFVDLLISFEPILSDRKLDWSHSTKGVLCLIPILGNVILLYGWISRKIDVSNIRSYLASDHYSLPLTEIPPELFKDRVFLCAALQAQSREAYAIFDRAPNEDKGDKDFVSQLVQNDLLSYRNYRQLPPQLQHDPDIALKFLQQRTGARAFTELPQNLQTVPELILEALNHVSSNVPGANALQILVCIEDTNLKQINPALYEQIRQAAGYDL